MTTECKMVIIENEDFTYEWECSKCEVKHKDTKKFEKSKTCPSCGAVITKWIGVDDEE